jgi:hypothetical protein
MCKFNSPIKFLLVILGMSLCMAAYSTPEPEYSEPPGGIVSWWPADGNSMDIINGNPGTILGGTGFTAGHVGQAFEFDGGSGNRIEISENASLGFTGGFSIEAWIQTTGSGTGSGGSFFADIMRKRNRDDRGSLDIYLGMMNDRARFGLVDDLNQFDAPTGIQGTTLINDGQWHHVAGEIRFYMDGLIEAFLTDTTSTYLEMQEVPWDIGNSPGSFKFPWNGLIDETSIYNRALSDEEIMGIFDAGTTGKCLPGTSIQPAGLWQVYP